MRLAFHTFPSACIATFVGFGLLTIQYATNNRARGEQFRPIQEAESPPGFPEYTMVGQIEVKQYPAYRKASASGPAEFWTLFSHIKQNGIKMTAPVEMDYGDPNAEQRSKRTMAFLYERPDQGSLGRQGDVEVIDVSPMTVVSIGCRGNQTSEAVEEARQKLLDYLAEKKGKYVAAGSMRVLAYNSPFVPRRMNYFEVQIPVRDSELTDRELPVDGEK